MNISQNFSWIIDKINTAKIDIDSSDILIETKFARDSLFKEVLDSFNGQPIKIFQIGAIESLEDKFRVGSGWSDMFWGLYIKKYGGAIVVAEMNLNHIANSSFLAQQLSYETNFIFGDANNFISKGYDIYYLDGADISYAADAYEQTLNQFKKIENENCVVLVDDLPSKGKLLLDYLKEKNIPYTTYDFGSGMIKIDMRSK